MTHYEREYRERHKYVTHNQENEQNKNPPRELDEYKPLYSLSMDEEKEIMKRVREETIARMQKRKAEEDK